jgi:hypothetical protein
MADRTEKRIYPDFPVNFMRVDWERRVKLFDLLIRQHGYKTEWTPVSTCPCVVNPKDGGKGVPQPNCLACKGTGRVYLEEKKKDIITFPHVINKRRILQVLEGELEYGSLRVVFQSKDRPQLWDRLKFVDMQIPTFEVRVVKDRTMKLRFHPYSIDTVMVNTDDEQPVIIPPDKYTYDEANWQIIFNTDEYNDRNVSVRYTSSPYYYIQNLTPEYRGTFIKMFEPSEKWVDLPITAIATRADLLEG